MAAPDAFFWLSSHLWLRVPNQELKVPSALLALCDVVGLTQCWLAMAGHAAALIARLQHRWQTVLGLGSHP